MPTHRWWWQVIKYKSEVKMNRTYQMCVRNGMKRLFLVFLLTQGLQAQAQIVIAGDVYGGGKQGAVGLANAKVNAETASQVELTTDTPQDISSVTVYGGSMRSVFGGGENGRTFGNTSVTVIDGYVGSYQYRNTILGGIYGGGEGASADVFGNSRVTIAGGDILQKVYGGGKQADLMGNTTVTLRGGNIHGRIFGGACMADVYGNAYVHVDGLHLADHLIADAIYGGNDISGTICRVLPENCKWTWLNTLTVPIPHEEGSDSLDIETIDNTYNAFVRTTSEAQAANEADQKHIFIGQVFGGGYGDTQRYIYNESTHQVVLKKWNPTTQQYDMPEGEDLAAHTYPYTVRPEIAKTYLQIGGGTIAFLYGGGNDVTVTKAVDICINNSSAVTTSIKHNKWGAFNAGNEYEVITKTRVDSMGINSLASHYDSDSYQFARVFGGNNKAPMAIRPTWHLKKGLIRDIYSGGNKGAMTHPNGIMLAIKSADMTIGTVYGGCRMADVNPSKRSISEEEIDGVYFPEGYAARVYITAGNIHDVYGGNDISGTVYGGSAVGIHSKISGDVYGGGNGSYPYTDNQLLSGTLEYGDYFYEIPDGKTSVEALDEFRPHAEAVSIRLSGTETKHVEIGGSIFCGGNSATLRSTTGTAKAQLKVGSYVYADNVFLGSNGANMVATSLLQQYKEGITLHGNHYALSTNINLLDKGQFATYMEGCAVDGVMPSVAFDSRANRDPEDYVPYSTYFGSVYCGGNVGSMRFNGLTTIDIADKIIIYNKVVGGCNNAYVPASPYNALYEGGLIGSAATNGDKLKLNLSGLKIQPKRWKMKTVDGNRVYDLDENGNRQLEWNTFIGDTEVQVAENAPTGAASPEDRNRRFKGGNIYGGCYNSGHVEGNVIINLNASIIDKDIVFDEIAYTEGEPLLYNDNYTITARHSGVILDRQGMDVLGAALNVFGGGKGKDTEIWGSTTINLNRGYTFQIFGGSEEGAIGKKKKDVNGNPVLDGSNYVYEYDAKYSTYVNLADDDDRPGVARGAAGDSGDLAEAEFIYGGGFEGLVAGDTHINLGNGRIFNSFAGSCNADILGHTETYIGTDGGFPWVRDHVYGGNDLGGKIIGSGDFSARVSDVAGNMVHKNNATLVLKASAYVEYNQGRVDRIFGGCYGDYDYESEYAGYTPPFFDNAFVNFKPVSNSNNKTKAIFGAGQGHSQMISGANMQNRSYVLIDIAGTSNHFKEMDVFGSGAFVGLGMGVDADVAGDAETADQASAIIDLARGQINAVYGGSYEEGITRRTVVNVPKGTTQKSTIKLNKIFGGAYGVHNNTDPCDVVEAIVNYHSEDASVSTIYGGNNSFRRTIHGTVNVTAPVWSDKANGKLATIFGAGFGENTWSEYTEVNLENGARIWEVYGGGENGRVLNQKSVVKYATAYQTATGETLWNGLTSGYPDLADDPLVKPNAKGERYNTNVRIKAGAEVGNYAYGGGLGDPNIPLSGDVCGTTYIELLGGLVKKDLYAAGTTGSVYDYYGVKGDFIASANAYIEGGTARNVYGGGWKGSVGYHPGNLSETYANDVLGETHVIIGKKDGASFTDGIPAVERNAYGGGEGGAVFGTANITLNNGYIGYRYHSDWNDVAGTTDIDERYEEKVDDETHTEGKLNTLYDSGCIFGGGYVDNSSVDVTNVKMYGGHVRNALFGGGEIAAIGRGFIEASGQDNSVRSLKGIYKAGKTHVELFEGHVHRNVFGGGRGYNNLGEGGKLLFSDGYVFGQTEVNIHGGEVGTTEGLEKGYGNVFGGGDIGYVYSAYEDNSKNLYVGIKDGDRYDDHWEGYYYAYKKGSEAYTPGTKPADNDPNWIRVDNEYVLTEDCKVLISPYCRAKSDVTIGHAYSAGQYVTTDDLNTMKSKKNDSNWSSLVDDGVIIHNAVFAGGNTSAGSASVYANATTVYGNATASIYDVYHRDLITIGTGHTGGLYGDGNLTFVDGYRELNITNYGTDYYTIDKQISLDAFRALPAREQAYYELRYKCVQECTDNEGKHYIVGSTITTDQLLALFKGQTGIVSDAGVPNSAYWVENGVCSRYAGRLMNTIQRADFCGVFGSRMVMQGAQDRVPEIVDYTNYTINRVREVSLNKKLSTAGDAVDSEGYRHGNYFGIYNIVNYLGALTSDVDFVNDVRTTTNISNDSYTPDSEGQTYANWKELHWNERKRNNGNSYNQVALASGVYLELTTEKSTGNELNQKDWGLITGVVELDLINVQTGIGGGFVYAKNEHGVRSSTGKQHVTLTALNANAISSDHFKYATDDANKKEWETSGNFVHSTQTIIDDCYNVSGKYKSGDFVPAHYWFIQGQVYVYDQIISAYTGAPNAYSETVDIPLTITAASHGTMKLLNVQPNKYAYYASTSGNTKVKLGATDKLEINDVTYSLNSPISYWDWYMLSSNEKSLFVDETYVSVADCKIGETTYPAGTVLLPDEYNSWQSSHPNVYHVEKQENVAFEEVFRSSNNVSHDTGYILTYKVNNPTEWKTWYTPKSSATPYEHKITVDAYDVLSAENKNLYHDGPTYRLTDGSGIVLGQRQYSVSNLISKEVYDTYQSIVTSHQGSLPGGQAEFGPAYIVTSQVATADGSLNPGTAVSAATAATLGDKALPAYICTSTIQLSKTEYIYLNSKMTEAEKNAYKTANPTVADLIDKLVVPAYYCTKAGLYGGDYYEAGKNYRGLEAWSSMSAADRAHFDFNYDALDLLIDPGYSRAEGVKYQYDGQDFETAVAAKANKAGYSLAQPVDYSATYQGSDAVSLPSNVTVKRGANTTSTNSIQTGDELSRSEYEKIPNEQRHYTLVNVPSAGDYYVVKNSFQVGSTPYAVGSTTTYDVYNNNQTNVAKLTFTESGQYYFCRESYQVGENGEGQTVTAVSGVTGGESGSYAANATVPVGLVIGGTNYEALVNKQKNFTIHGISPTETSTLYVSRSSDIFDLSTEKIITVIYQYDYEESDQSGNVTPVSERHVVNIHLQFKSGIPTVEDIVAPELVLPGSKIGMREPNVTPGAYEVTGGGWELFEKVSDAESHTNGIEYVPNADPLYWYQDGYRIAYYAKTYLGKTYSNHVPLTVANYHDLKQVMDDKDNHLHVDYDPAKLKRHSKIYINDYSAESQNSLDMFKSFIDLSLNNATKPAGHAALDTKVKGGAGLEFILRSNLDHTGTWNSIAGGSGECFSGTLHGDGYTISGLLTNSLFGHLCGNVYNLGVTGSFTSAGVADEGDGYVENCWVMSSAETVDGNKLAVLGHPSDGSDNDGKQIVNCYYLDKNQYSETEVFPSHPRGVARKMTAREFYNGTVAYNLNGFYLNKRYYDGTNLGEGKQYQYFVPNADGTLPTATTEAYYPSGYAIYPLEKPTEGKLLGYVENRITDGDYIYANGTIPETNDIRMRTVTVGNETTKTYAPIWPDDYLYFGQALNYGHMQGMSHQDVPSHIVKTSDRLPTDESSNRVYRAPAYFGNSTMDVAHFNPHAIFAKTKFEEPNVKAYEGMTAIDFTGYNDAGYQQGLNGNYFFQPLLDDDGLIGFTNADLTQNLLVYTYTGTTAAAKTNAVIKDDEFMQDLPYTETNATYHTAKKAIGIENVRGHWVQKVESNYVSTRDHVLVDDNDFNAPIAYTFDNSHRMWYQRMPDRYVTMASGKTQGWEDISLPFEVALVTTPDKGEITHFYQNSTTGHEYWLREFTGTGTATSDELPAIFTYPALGTNNKDYTNTFLYDYYYSHNNYDDKNNDDYHQSYYKTGKTWTQYPLQQAGTPYLIGFPGAYYYEFDLSGDFRATTALKDIPDKLQKQAIIFVSNPGVTINVSDGELTAGVVRQGSSQKYDFHPNYATKQLAVGDYMLASTGDRYEKLTEAKTARPFRPYFVKGPAGTRTESEGVKKITFNEEMGQLKGVSDNLQEKWDDDLIVKGGKKKIKVESELHHTTDVRIVTPAGMTLTTYAIEPGETIETRVETAGVYIVYGDNGKYVKKVIVK